MLAHASIDQLGRALYGVSEARCVRIRLANASLQEGVVRHRKVGACLLLKEVSDWAEEDVLSFTSALQQACIF